jgi:hypothetical protein
LITKWIERIIQSVADNFGGMVRARFATVLPSINFVFYIFVKFRKRFNFAARIATFRIKTHDSLQLEVIFSKSKKNRFVAALNL